MGKCEDTQAEEEDTRQNLNLCHAFQEGQVNGCGPECEEECRATQGRFSPLVWDDIEIGVLTQGDETDHEAKEEIGTEVKAKDKEELAHSVKAEGQKEMDPWQTTEGDPWWKNRVTQDCSPETISEELRRKIEETMTQGNT